MFYCIYFIKPIRTEARFTLRHTLNNNNIVIFELEAHLNHAIDSCAWPEVIPDSSETFNWLHCDVM